MALGWTPLCPACSRNGTDHLLCAISRASPTVRERHLGARYGWSLNLRRITRVLVLGVGATSTSSSIVAAASLGSNRPAPPVFGIAG